MPRTEPGEPVTLLLLAGGQSRRMGTDKLALPFPDQGGPPLIEWVRRRLAPLADETLLAGPRAYGLGCRTVQDPKGVSGPLAGLLAGLSSSRTDLVLAAAADLPLASPGLARLLLGLASRLPGRQAVVPSHGGRLEPLLAVYRRSAVERLGRLVPPSAGRSPSLRFGLSLLNLRTVAEDEWLGLDPAGLSFLNCNTREEFCSAARIVTQGGTA